VKTAKELLQAYIDGTAQQSAALFAEKGELELPYLADLGVDPRYEGPKAVGAFLTFLHEKMYPGFKFTDVKIYIDTPDQAFGEYTIHQKSGISGNDVHQRFFGHCTAANGKIILLREALNVLAAADGMFPGGIADVVQKKAAAEAGKRTPLSEEDRKALATSFIEALKTQDEKTFQKIMHDDVIWTLPGSSVVSGIAQGVSGILKRAQAIVDRGVTLEIMHVILGYEGVALQLHNTGKRKGNVLDEYLTTVCTVRDGKIARLDTYISDIPMVNKYFV
jgi:ketosteroid isomerase-like protein